MPTMTVSQAIVRFLASQWSEMDGQRARLIGGLWGIWGHGNVPGFSQGMEEFGEDLPFHQPKNEQAMVHAAMGYAKAMNRRATMACSASIGPGAANMLTGAATATVNRIPVLLLPSDTFASRRPGNVLQELEHPVDLDVSVNDAFRPLSRFFDRVSRPEQLLPALPAAMRVLTDPAETGAVTLSLPQDVQGEALDVPADWLAPRTWTIERRPPVPGSIAAAAEAIRAARRPMIVAGGGVRYAAAEAQLLAFADRHGIPVAETHAGKGIAARVRLHLGGQGLSGTDAAAACSREADLVICIGTRLSDFTTASRSAFADPQVRFVLVNVNAKDAAKLRGVPVVADARLALEALDTALGEWTAPEAWQDAAGERIARWQARYAADLRPRQGQPLSQAQVFAAVNAAAKPGDVVVAAAGTPPGEIKKGWDASKGEEVFLEFGFSCMGHEIPAGLGVRLARPEAGEVFVVIGDGTFLLAPSEIVTAVQEGAKITVVVVDNGGYQCIRDLQQATQGIESTGREDFGNEFRRKQPGERVATGDYLALDHARIAEGMGARAIRAETDEGLRAALDEARAHSGPVVIVVPADKRAASAGNDHWWDLGVAATSGREGARAARERLDAGRAEQRVLS